MEVSFVDILDCIFWLVIIIMLVKELKKDTPEPIKNIFRACAVGFALPNIYYSLKEIIVLKTQDMFLLLVLVISSIILIVYGSKLISSYLKHKSDIAKV